MLNAVGVLPVVLTKEGACRTPIRTRSEVGGAGSDFVVLGDAVSIRCERHRGTTITRRIDVAVEPVPIFSAAARICIRHEWVGVIATVVLADAEFQRRLAIAEQI